MATTTPDDIKTPDSGDQYALVQDLGAMADTVQNALNRRANSYIVGTRNELTGWNPGIGSKAYAKDTGKEYIQKASGWQGANPLTGQTTLTAPSGGGNVTQVVTFPAGYFTATPHVLVSAADGAGVTVVLNLSAVTVTKDSFVINMNRSNTTATRVNWAAHPSN